MGQPELREYAQTELLSPIATGIRYLVSFYVSLSDTSSYAVSTIGAHFSTTPIGSNDVWALPFEADVINNPSDSLIDPTMWYHITDTFLSRHGGGERYLTIGNFNTAAESDTVQVRQGWEGTVHMSYYYIDDVSVVALDTLSSVAEAAQWRMAIWPNPATAAVQLQWPVPLQQGAQVMLQDAQGRTVLRQPVAVGSTMAQLHVAHLPPGLYVAEVRQGGGPPMRERLIIVRE